MSAKTGPEGAVQRDWRQREVVEVVKMQVLKIVEFLNKFGTCATSPFLHRRRSR